jgi:hypothetical protein
MGLQLTQGMKNPRSSNHSLLNRCAFLCHPERSRGICSSADLSWKHGISSRHKLVISTEAQRSGEISVLTPLPGNVFQPERSGERFLLRG